MRTSPSASSEFTILPEEECAGGEPISQGKAGSAVPESSRVGGLLAILPEEKEKISEAVEGWPYELLPSVSSWSITTFRTCPEQFRRTVILRERQPPRAARLRGTAGHKAHEKHFVHKLGTGEDFPHDDLIEYFNDEAWPKALEQDGGLTEIDWSDEAKRQLKPVPEAKAKKQEIADAAREYTARLVSLYHNEAATKLIPAAVEEWFELDVGLAVPLKGRIDLVAERDPALTQSGAIGETMVIDHKFTASAGQKPGHRFQGRIYQLARPVPFENHLSLAPKPAKNAKSIPEPKVVAFDPAYRLETPDEWERERTVRSVKATMVQIAHLANTIGPDDPWPDAMTHDWACSYCGFGPNGADVCVWWKRS